MGESDLHKYLKLLGVKYLDSQGCTLIGDEIFISKYESNTHLETGESDSRFYIDVVGLGKRNIMGIATPWGLKKIGDEEVLRGIEVKVSRGDFSNGYVQSGLHYHYLLVPELLVKKSEVPKHFGLLYWKEGSTYVDVVKKPVRQELNHDMIEHYRKKIYRRYHTQIMSLVSDQVDLLRASFGKQTKRM